MRFQSFLMYKIFEHDMHMDVRPHESGVQWTKDYIFYDKK